MLSRKNPEMLDCELPQCYPHLEPLLFLWSSFIIAFLYGTNNRWHTTKVV
jgi:hypothetical protein